MKYKIALGLLCVIINFSVTASTSSKGSIASASSIYSTVTKNLKVGILSEYLLRFKKYIDELNDHLIAEKLRKNLLLIEDNIQIAVYSGQGPYAEILLAENNGIKSKIINYEYDEQRSATLLHLAIDIAQYHKQKIYENNDYLKLKKFYAEKYKKMLNVIQILIDNGADIDAQDCYGMTPLHKACICYDMIISNILIDEYANIHILDNDGKKAEEYIEFHGKKKSAHLINADHANLVYKLKNPPIKKRSLYACIIATLFGESIKIAPSS